MQRVLQPVLQPVATCVTTCCNMCCSLLDVCRSVCATCCTAILVFRHAIAEGPSSIVHCCNGSRHVCRRPVSIGPSGITRIGSAELAARLCAPAAPWDVSIVWRPTRFPNSRCSGGALGECACRCACMSAHMRMYAGARAREFARGWRMLRVRGSARTQNHRSLDGLAEVLEVYPPWCCKRISEQLRVPVQRSMSLCRL